MPMNGGTEQPPGAKPGAARPASLSGEGNNLIP